MARHFYGHGRPVESMFGIHFVCFVDGGVFAVVYCDSVLLVVLCIC